MKRPDIEYPCDWGYKIIGEDQELLKDTAAKIINDRDYTISVSGKSRTGKYTSLDIKTRVLDQSDRNKIFSDFSNHPSVKKVL
ncbi:MAG: DUF493 domain-containing protein [Candidatus Omnitrophica bacterium]|nr:DUF493 domain-containing protein [Candidatus Omnitrophota bacterium]MCF7894283.1 DUF493 domain-containing protein [Candidatus Omnitrophota bacterium]